ncbi:uncharacterized protein LOC122646489 isoform X3 [Telopea speciosissima]|uniref:uncharacterized protein LOC122646489 isoform X3 n=1 Tax=Telopea speciosissima TaxID=54955 RepID=UPI001CC6A4AD|nr:uncharacterized protein LOC122646489 isoform X3 [Telopea speciosissima]
MDRRIQSLLNRLSCAAVTVATVTLILLFVETPQTCITDEPSAPQVRFPKSSCEATHREIVSIEKKNKRLWSTRDWQKKVNSFTELFHGIRQLGLLANHSRVLCVSAGAGYEVMALSEMGVTDITGVELIDSPPLFDVVVFVFLLSSNARKRIYRKLKACFRVPIFLVLGMSHYLD